MAKLSGAAIIANSAFIGSNLMEPSGLNHFRYFGIAKASKCFLGMHRNPCTKNLDSMLLGVAWKTSID